MSVQVIRMSCTPRAFKSVRTPIQKEELSDLPTHTPRTSFKPFYFQSDTKIKNTELTLNPVFSIYTKYFIVPIIILCFTTETGNTTAIALPKTTQMYNFDIYPIAILLVNRFYFFSKIFLYYLFDLSLRITPISSIISLVIRSIVLFISLK